MTTDEGMLAALWEDLREAPEVYHPSPFWEELAAYGMRQLQESGFEHFKRTVNMRYFNWNVMGILRHQLLPVLAWWCRHPRSTIFTAKFPRPRSRRTLGLKSFNQASATIYRLYVAMLWEYVAARDPFGVLRSLEEPAFGDPFRIRYRQRWVSQDLCNSVHEWYSAGADDAAAGTGRGLHVAELGAGYGRLAYVFLRALPASTYCLIDIPPALYIAQQYLSAVLPGESFFRFRRFTRYEEIREEFEGARIRFLSAPQIECLPPESVDLMVSISTLHEMTSRQIAHYLAQVDRVCRGRFYMKQWRLSRTPENGGVITERDYPIPASWTRIYHRPHPIQRLFFEALYQVR